MTIVCRLTAYDCHIDMFCTRCTSITWKLGLSVFMKAATTPCFSPPSGSLVSSAVIGSAILPHVDGGLSASEALSPICFCSTLSWSADGCCVRESGNQPACVERPSTPSGGRSSITSCTTEPNAQPSLRCLLVCRICPSNMISASSPASSRGKSADTTSASLVDDLRPPPPADERRGGAAETELVRAPALETRAAAGAAAAISSRRTERWKLDLTLACFMVVKSIEKIMPVCWLAAFCSVPVEPIRSARSTVTTAGPPPTHRP
mmetsp:Transcript_2713/g.6807  ORF Transcript_2713/g.6807 Transcript_2713/m.6807 type:complete len:263 (+) Transcript_2713:593-1381(+)